MSELSESTLPSPGPRIVVSCPGEPSRFFERVLEELVKEFIFWVMIGCDSRLTWEDFGRVAGLFLCRQEHFTRDFSHVPYTCDHTHIVAQGVSGAHSFHPRAIHDVTCLSVRCLSSFCLLSLCLSLLLFLFHCLPVLCPAQLPQCRHRRGLKPLHSRTMRNIAPWRYTILLQVMSPSSSTTSTTQRLLQWCSRMSLAT